MGTFFALIAITPPPVAWLPSTGRIRTMLEKSISTARQSVQSVVAGDKPRNGDAMIRVFQSRMAERQRAERERRDRYGRFGGR